MKPVPVPVPVFCAASALAAALLAIAGPAHAYHNGDFATPVSQGGGNGMYFTGSARGKRLDCTACHALSAGAIGIELTSEPAELLADGRWTPGQTYALTVRMTGEHLGDTGDLSGIDNNSFVAEFNTDGGSVVGSWASADPTRVFTMDAAGGDPGIVGGYDGAGGTEWVMTWQAPDAGAGRLSLHLGAVDGNAAGGGVATVVDPFGDDVFIGAWRFCEGSSACDRGFPNPSEEDIDDASESAAKGCGIAGPPSGAFGFLVLTAWLLLLARRRLWAVVAVLALAGAGCIDSGGEPVVTECPNGICEYSSADDPLGDNPTLNEPFFRCQVQPVLQARCANFVCHGDNARPYLVYAPGRLRLDGTDEGESFGLTTALEFRTNKSGAEEFSLGTDAEKSLLLLKPLDSRAGGYYHFGQSLYYQSDVFETPGDLGYAKILDWIGGATASPDCTPTKETGP